jgi:hypothetical protein
MGPNTHHFRMKTVKLVSLTMVQMVRRVCLVSRKILTAGKQRQRRALLNQRETERLDRICNPSKYRGK